MSDPSSQPTQPLADEELAQMRARSVDPYFPYIGQMLKDVPRLLDEVSRLRTDNTAQAAKITEHQLLASAVRRLLGSPTRSSVLELLDVIAGARSEVATPGVLGEVAAERARQDAKWGEQNHPDYDPHDIDSVVRNEYGFRAERWKEINDRRAKQGCEVKHVFPAASCTAWDGVLLEEVYEALAEHDPAKLREELVQTAAVAVAWIEALDRRALGLDQNEEGQANG